MQSKFLKTCLMMLVLILLILGVRFLFFADSAPTMRQVLTHNPPANDYDLSMFIVSLLAFSFATLSVAKGYEILRRTKEVVVSVLPAAADEAVSGSAKNKKDQYEILIEEMKKSIDKLMRKEDCLEQENSVLREQVKNLSSDSEDLTRVEQMLRKSNISLSKECERLKAESETIIAGKTGKRKRVKSKK
ncbi:hypothetical protein A3J44_03495 [candidate division WOR-1 bacterium RIFCSPHIGHO2_02_FULL_45_12]|nr:MAG: hypothetical protein A3J44_03495 [candidate division WOR-1 bacterium RIFCSPHIGHO2_02_FULL_45_12]OGC10049.1 MAG: hypothetical protein A3F86_02360 [candidate division WOR-1 bacterium RIFCSPLOWO2_12_FULL_45_9]